MDIYAKCSASWDWLNPLSFQNDGLRPLNLDAHPLLPGVPPQTPVLAALVLYAIERSGVESQERTLCLTFRLTFTLTFSKGLYTI